MTRAGGGGGGGGDVGAVRVLHCHSSFGPGGKELRSVRLMNAFGAACTHTVISGEPGVLGAAAHLDPRTAAAFPADFPPLSGTPTPWRLASLAEALKGYDLILTYNWGAMDVVMAHTVFARAMGLGPLVHHEDGFNEDEALALKPQRNLYRRIALNGTPRLIVPSTGLERIALERWHQPRARVVRIANGIDTAAFAAVPDPAGLRVIKRPGERWVGTLAGLRSVKRLDRLIAAAARLPEEWHLVIFGEGPEREALLAAAAACEVSHRVHLPGAITDPARVIGLIDIFALSSASEQFPLSVVEAMAAGLPVAAPAVGDIAAMVAEPNRPFITPPDDDAGEALAAALASLAAEPELRARIGAENRVRARAHYDEAGMIAAYRALYSEVLGRAL